MYVAHDDIAAPDKDKKINKFKKQNRKIWYFD